jgi:hypothetical protein
MEEGAQMNEKNKCNKATKQTTPVADLALDQTCMLLVTIFTMSPSQT